LQRYGKNNFWQSALWLKSNFSEFVKVRKEGKNENRLRGESGLRQEGGH